MEHYQVYQGHTVRIVTSRAYAQSWQFHVEITDDPTQRVGGGTARSEQDAYAAGLTAAMAVIDQSRAKIGKP